MPMIDVTDGSTTRRELKLPFLGQRTYLHGTTLFDALLDETGDRVDPLLPLSYKLSRRIDSDCVMIDFLADPGEMDRQRHVASLTFSDQRGAAQIAGVVPLPKSKKPLRMPYDEERVSSAASAGVGMVSLGVVSPFSFVTSLIPLHKMLLHQEGIVPDTPGQWFFTRLDLENAPAADFLPLSLELDSVFGGGRLVRSYIAVAGEKIGVIYFSWV